MEDMDRSNTVSRRLSGCKEGTLVDRTRSTVTNGLRKKLKELMMDFQGLRQRMMTEYKDTIRRQYYTITGEYPIEEVIEKIISNENGHGGEEFLARAIQERGRGKVVETVVEIQDMAVMVEAQGEQMDDIQHHVMNAAQYVNDGSKNLKTAKGY